MFIVICPECQLTFKLCDAELYNWMSDDFMEEFITLECPNPNCNYEEDN